MSARHKRAHKRIQQLEELLDRAADYIDSAADVIEDLDGGDLDGENADAHQFADKIRKAATVRR